MAAESEFYKTQRALQSLTETNLKKEFENVLEFCQSAIHFANRCNISLALKHVVFAEISGSYLRQEAQRKYSGGLITKGEFTDILDKSLDFTVDLLTIEVTKSIIETCDCRKA